MILMPKNYKHSKLHVRSKRLKRMNKQQFSNCISLISKQPGFICGKQLDFMKSVLRRTLKKTLKITINFSVNSAISKKPNEIRMGKGKAELCY